MTGKQPQQLVVLVFAVVLLANCTADSGEVRAGRGNESETSPGAAYPDAEETWTPFCNWAAESVESDRSTVDPRARLAEVADERDLEFDSAVDQLPQQCLSHYNEIVEVWDIGRASFACEPFERDFATARQGLQNLETGTNRRDGLTDEQLSLFVLQCGSRADELAQTSEQLEAERAAEAAASAEERSDARESYKERREADLRPVMRAFRAEWSRLPAAQRQEWCRIRQNREQFEMLLRMAAQEADGFGDASTSETIAAARRVLDDEC